MKNNENPGKKPIPYLIKQEDLRMNEFKCNISLKNK